MRDSRSIPRRMAGIAAVMAFVLIATACGDDGPDTSAHMERARQHRAAGELRAASIELKNVLQSNAEHAGARLLLGKVYVEMGRGGAAEKELRRADKLGVPASRTAYWRARAIGLQSEYARLLEEIEVVGSWPMKTRGRVAAVRAQAELALDNPGAAREELERAEVVAPDELATHVARVRGALVANRTEQAVELAAEATAAYPESPRLWRLSARAALAAGNLEAAERHLTQAIEHAFSPHFERLMRVEVRLSRGRNDAAREDLDWLSEHAPDDPRVRFFQGLLAWSSGEREQACSHFAEVVGRAPNMREARYYTGVCHFRDANYNQAANDLETAYQGRAVPPVARMLGATYLAQERYARAREVLRPVLQGNPEDAGALALMAKLERAAGNSSQAIAHLRRLAELRPDDPDVRLQLGLGLFRSGEIGAGQAALAEALTLDSGAGQAGALLVLSQIREEEYEAALSTARDLAAKQPGAPLPRTLAGLVHVARGDRDAGRAAFEQALERASSDPGARHSLARMALEDGDAETAREHYQAVLDAYPEHTRTLTSLAVLEARTGHPGRVESLLARAHKADPGALRPRLLLARFRLSREEPADALRVLEGEDGEIPGSADALQLASQAHLAAGEPAQAEDTIQRLRELRPESTVPYLLLAQAYRAQGRAADTMAQMDRILELDPENPLALIVKARVSLGEGNEGSARDYLQRVPDDAREHPAYLSARAGLALAAGDRKTARDYYRRAYERAPSARTVTRLAAIERVRGNTDRAEELLRSWVADHPEARKAHQALGDLYTSVGRTAEAASAYKAVLEQHPGSVRALNNLAWVLREQAPSEALGYADHAARLQPEDPRVLDTLGMVLLENGDARRAVRRLREAVELAPRAGTLRYHLAEALVATGRENEARRELETALADAPPFEDIEEARELLSQLEGGQ